MVSLTSLYLKSQLFTWSDSWLMNESVDRGQAGLTGGNLLLLCGKAAGPQFSYLKSQLEIGRGAPLNIKETGAV